MNQIKNYVLGIFILFLVYPNAAHAVPAFPGAEGFGAKSVGGRGGQVIKVTNLNDSGPGSFRAAATASGPRIVVFNVSGIIRLTSILKINNPFITIAGETSPGGILVTGRPTRFNTHDVISRHMRWRVGAGNASGKELDSQDAVQIWGKWVDQFNDGYNLIFDHNSFSWGVDENVEVAYAPRDITFQWSVFSEGLLDAGHSEKNHGMGMLIWGKHAKEMTVSLHHNYFAHNRERNPEINGNDSLFLDSVNNVVYQWFGGLTSSASGGVKANFMNNYARQGPVSNGYSFEVTYRPPGGTVGSDSNPIPRFYVHGNIGSSRLSQSEPQWNIGEFWQNIRLSTLYRKDTRWSTLPWSNTKEVPPVTNKVMSESVASCILTAVGAMAPVRDSVDVRVVNNFHNRTGGFKGNVSSSDYPTFQNLTPPTDTDNDGMPDTWETAQGLDSNNPLDGNQDKDNNGYTDIEDYLHHLSAISYTHDTVCMPVPPVPDTQAPNAPTGLIISP